MTKIRNPVCILLLSVVFFLFADALIFRSGLYLNLMSPDSVAGKLFYFAKFEKLRPASGKEDVLLTGDSKMEWGFSVKAFSAANPNSDLNFIQGGIPASTLKIWYYIFSVIDPHHDRYAAIVVPIAGYQINPQGEDNENRIDTAQVLTPFLGFSGWRDLLETYSDKNAKASATLFALAEGHAYATDVQDLLLRSWKRHKKVPARNRAGEHWNEDDSSHEGSIEGLVYDPVTQKISAYPSYFTAAKRRKADNELRALSNSDAQRLITRNAAYMSFWLRRVVALYAGSRTRLIFIQIPSDPIKRQSNIDSKSEQDIRNMIPAQQNVIVLNSEEFEFLEQPKYFYDTLHLNREGRQLFTSMLAERIQRILAGS